jgi:hypothetical protein
LISVIGADNKVLKYLWVIRGISEGQVSGHFEWSSSFLQEMLDRGSGITFLLLLIAIFVVLDGDGVCKVV